MHDNEGTHDRVPPASPAEQELEMEAANYLARLMGADTDITDIVDPDLGGDLVYNEAVWFFQGREYIIKVRLASRCRANRSG
jgi:hypothetical protein